MRLVVVFFITLVEIQAAAPPNRPVTNEDIRDAILSVVHMIRSTEDKLERHEYRERALGDQIKKALTTIDKRQKLLDPVKGTLSRIDERLAAVETILMQKDERERIQLQKTNELVEQIHRNLPKMFETLKNDITSSFPRDEPGREASPSKSDLEQFQKEIGSKIENISQNVVKNIEKIREDNKNNLQLNAHTSVNLEDIKRHINNSEHVLEKYDHKLAEYNNRKDKNDVQANILQALERQKSDVDLILVNIRTIATKVPKFAEISDVVGAKNEALKSLEQIKKDLSYQSSLIENKIADLRKSLDQNAAKVQKTIETLESKSKNDLSSKILQVVEQQMVNVDQILTNVKNISNKVPNKIADMADIQAAKNEALKYLEQIKKDASHHTSEIENKITDLRKITEQNNAKLQKTIENIDANTRNDLHPHVLQALQQQKVDADHILSGVKTIMAKMPNKVADVADVQDAIKLLEQNKNVLITAAARLEEKLIDIQKKTGESTAAPQKDLQPAILQTLELQKANVDQILAGIHSIADKVPNKVVDLLTMNDVKTRTLESLEQMKNEIVARGSLVEEKLNNIHKLTEQIKGLEALTARRDLQTQLLQAMELQKTSLDKILTDVHVITDKALYAAEAKDVERIEKNTLKALEDISNQFAVNYDLVNKKFEEVQWTAERNNASIHKTIESEKTLVLPIILQAIEKQGKGVQDILLGIKVIDDKLPAFAPKPNAELAKNETLQSLQQIKDEIIGQSLMINDKIAALHTLSEKNNDNLQKTIVESGEMAEQLNANVATSFEKLSNSVRSLNKLDQVMVQTADAVLDTKRRIEYGVHQIVLDVTAIVKKQAKELNSTINARFDNLEFSILDAESGALSNLTTRVSTEIDQVWRQIGIMHQQMGANTDTLEKIQAQTDSYINGSATTMDNMRGKVTQITSRMAEVDDNLNYLLGRLSLVTQEFNRIKSGLGEALDQIKGSFNAVQQKLRETGPGPHPIASSELEDLNYNKTNAG